MIPLRLWIKILWTATVVGGVFIPLNVYWFLFYLPTKPSNVVLPEVAVEQQTLTDPKTHPLEFYSESWNTQVNVKQPKTDIGPTPPQNWLEQLIKRHLSIKQIITDNFAVVIVDNVEQLVEPKTPSNEKDVSKRWLLTMEGTPVTIKKIVPGKGIRFESVKQNVKQEVNIEHKIETSGSKSDTKSGQPIEVGANQWMIPEEERNNIAQNFNQYIEELSPESTPQGLKIRRVYENSKARQYGLQANDIVTNINGTPVRSMQNVYDFVRRNKNQKRVVVQLLRNSQKLNFTFEIR